jgi:hypothetical protein
MTKKTLLLTVLVCAFSFNVYSQETTDKLNHTLGSEPVNNSDVMYKDKEPETKWSLNLSFSDNGFGIGATKYFNLSKDISLLAGISFSNAKDEREFEQYDLFGNSETPYKVNRLFMAPMVNLGMQIRLFREDVSDNMRPHVSFGVTPAAIVYTPYDKPLLESFGYARAKYTVGGFAGVGLDYLSGNTTALSFNVRYYYLNLFGEGINSLSTQSKKDFGGIYFMFNYNFMK